MKKISLFLNTFEFANNRESFGEKVTKNIFITGNFTGKGFGYFLYVCYGCSCVQDCIECKMTCICSLKSVKNDCWCKR